MGAKIVTYLLLLLLLASSVATQPRSQCIGICDQPLLVRLYKSGPQSIPSATPTDVTFQGETIDEANFHDTVTNTERITAPVAGVYIGACFLDWASSTASTRTTRVVLNGTSTIFQVNADANTELPAPEYTGTFMVSLNAGDYLTCRASQGTGSALNVAGTGEYGSSFFWLMRIK